MLVYHPDGRLAGKYAPGDYILGAKALKWSPSGQFLAVGGYDQKVEREVFYPKKEIDEIWVGFPSQVNF